MADATVVLNQTLNGQSVKNVLVFSNMLQDEVALQAFADNLRLDYTDNEVEDTLVQEWSLDSITVVFNDSLPIFSINVPFTEGVLNGVSSAQQVANQTSMVVSTSYFGVPPNRGRVYLCGFSASHMTDGLWENAIGTLMENLIQGWAIDGISDDTSTCFLRIARRSTGGVLLTSNPVTGVQYQENPATQRRRRIGVGS